MLTIQQIADNWFFSDDEIKQDIEETQSEIDSYEIILQELYKNRHENKLQIYLYEGKILQRKEFVTNLRSIQSLRKEKL